MSALEADLTGFEPRVPQAQQVAEVRLDTPSFAPYDNASSPSVLHREEDIARLVELHQTIVDHQSQLEAEESAYSYSYASEMVGEHMVDVETSGTVYFSFTYLFRNGGTMQRGYRIPVNEALLADPASPAAKLDALINAPGLAEQEYLSLYRSGDVLTSVNLSTYMGADQIFSNGADTQRLLDAVRTDLEEGNLGRHYLLENKEKVVTRESLLDHVWGFDYVGETNAVDVYIRFLRAKLEEPFGEKLIHTVRGVGYVIRETGGGAR